MKHRLDTYLIPCSIRGFEALILVGGLFWLWGARYLERDTIMAPMRLRP